MEKVKWDSTVDRRVGGLGFYKRQEKVDWESTVYRDSTVDRRQGRLGIYCTKVGE